MRTERWVKVLMIVLTVALLVSALAVVAQQRVGRAANLPTETEQRDQINAMVIIGGTGTNKIIAAGTNDGIKIFQVARVGNYFEVRDITRYSSSTGAEVLRSEGAATPRESTTNRQPRLPRGIDRGHIAPTPETPKDRLPHHIDRGR